MYFLSEVWEFMCEARCSLTLVVYSHRGQHSSLGPALLLRVLFLLGAGVSSWSLFLLVAEPGLEDEDSKGGGVTWTPLSLRWDTCKKISVRKRCTLDQS